VPEKWDHVPQMPKPYKLEDVEAVLLKIFGRDERTGPSS
jgi:hypothetical protein